MSAPAVVWKRPLTVNMCRGPMYGRGKFERTVGALISRGYLTAAGYMTSAGAEAFAVCAARTAGGGVRRLFARIERKPMGPLAVSTGLAILKASGAGQSASPGGRIRFTDSMEVNANG